MEFTRRLARFAGFLRRSGLIGHSAAMPLHPQAKAFINQLSLANGAPTESLSIEEARRLSAEFKKVGGLPEPIAQVTDVELPGPAGPIPVRVYRPDVCDRLPVVLFFHGGGWALGDLDSYESPCRALANASGCVVVSVAYRLAPEHKFPAGLQDCYAATRYVVERSELINVDARHVVVAGDSAGANLAAAVCLMARDRGGPLIACQVLIYPVTDYSFDTGSYREMAEGYFLTRNEMAWFWGLYLARESDGHHPYASVLRMSDLRGLPPAVIVTAEYDPLRDEGEAYASRLHEAGVSVDLRRYAGMIHGFFAFPALFDAGRQATVELGAKVRRVFSPA